jgi:hypothetical protein
VLAWNGSVYFSYLNSFVVTFVLLENGSLTVKAGGRGGIRTRGTSEALFGKRVPYRIRD